MSYIESVLNVYKDAVAKRVALEARVSDLSLRLRDEESDLRAAKEAERKALANFTQAVEDET